MTETFEAVQCLLGETGIILWPGTPENPPKRISAEEIYLAQPRVFKEANEKGPIFNYKFSHGLQWWYLSV